MINQTNNPTKETNMRTINPEDSLALQQHDRRMNIINQTPSIDPEHAFLIVMGIVGLIMMALGI